MFEHWKDETYEWDHIQAERRQGRNPGEEPPTALWIVGAVLVVIVVVVSVVGLILAML